jgi:ATP/maltotriose-dependent transcriptional regulator MalT
MMKEVLASFIENQRPPQEALRWLWLGSLIAADLWDDESWARVADLHVRLSRELGALSELPHALDARASLHLLAGELADAAVLFDEAGTIHDVTGSAAARVGPLCMAAFRGQEREARELIDQTLADAIAHGQGAAVSVTRWCEAVLWNGRGEYERALRAAEISAAEQDEFSVVRRALVELVEAGVRSGNPERAVEALEQLTPTTRASTTRWAQGIEARCRALLSEGDVARALYQDALRLLSGTGVKFELARAHLLYGEWLRREGERADAREELSVAHAMLTEFGARAFADRARDELAAAGASVPRPAAREQGRLTRQESQIARLAADGLTNPEIGARLFLSRHTVEWHLRKVFSKLGIASRREISAVLRPHDPELSS